MVYEADQSVTLLEALAEAGGITNDAGDTIIVTRAHAFVMIPNPEPIRLRRPERLPLRNPHFGSPS